MVKVGIIGLGEVAQIIHLPIVQSLREQYEITALCDVSPGLLEALGRQYGVPRLYAEADDLIADPEVEAVFVLNSDEYHADCIVSAAHHGKHVFVEKPLCLNVPDAERIIEAKNRSGIRIMVGYMRRYAPAFVQAVEEVRKLEKINYARVKDIIGPNAYFIGQSSNVLRFQDIPAARMEDRRRRGQEQVAVALGERAANYYDTYRLLGGLSSHDLSAMRELLGMPEKVIAATRWNGGLFMNALFQYADGYNVLFETGVDRQGRFDASLEVIGETKTIRVDYNTGYIRHLPTTLTMLETEGDALRETVTRPSFTDAYTIELLHFHDALTAGAEIKSTPEDFVQDLKLFRQLVEAMDRTQNK